MRIHTLIRSFRLPQPNPLYTATRQVWKNIENIFWITFPAIQSAKTEDFSSVFNAPAAQSLAPANSHDLLKNAD
jgi:hypothetical protein